MITLYHGIPRKSRVFIKFFEKNKGQKRGKNVVNLCKTM
nr:MAG TPA: hypothetical protein [Caudoviricetes sp.]